TDCFIDQPNYKHLCVNKPRLVFGRLSEGCHFSDSSPEQHDNILIKKLPVAKFVKLCFRNKSEARIKSQLASHHILSPKKGYSSVFKITAVWVSAASVTVFKCSDCSQPRPLPTFGERKRFFTIVDHRQRLLFNNPFFNQPIFFLCDSF